MEETPVRLEAHKTCGKIVDDDFGKSRLVIELMGLLNISQARRIRISVKFNISLMEKAASI